MKEVLEKAKQKICEDFALNKRTYMKDFSDADDFVEMYHESILTGGDDDFYQARMTETGENELHDLLRRLFEEAQPENQESRQERFERETEYRDHPDDCKCSWCRPDIHHQY
jgi:hypothetical protein